jgi:hypothetical protein
LDPANRALWEGISVFDSLGAARTKARRYPDLGKFVAVLQVPPGENISVAQTGRRREGHHTIWAEPGILLACVVDVVPVESESER